MRYSADHDLHRRGLGSSVLMLLKGDLQVLHIIESHHQNALHRGEQIERRRRLEPREQFVPPTESTSKGRFRWNLFCERLPTDEQSLYKVLSPYTTAKDTVAPVYGSIFWKTVWWTYYSERLLLQGLSVASSQQPGRWSQYPTAPWWHFRFYLKWSPTAWIRSPREQIRNWFGEHITIFPFQATCHKTGLSHMQCSSRVLRTASMISLIKSSSNVGKKRH